MKKIFFGLFLWLFSITGVFAQCSGCISAIPLVDNGFSQYIDGSAPLLPSFSCYTPGYSTVDVGPHFCNPYVPNWISVNGAPTIGSGFVTTHELGLCGSANTAPGSGASCTSVGSQGVAAYYPFLVNGQYQVTINFDKWYNDLGGTNAYFNVSAASGLVQNSPLYFLEPSIAGTTPIGATWNPDPYTEIYTGDTRNFCSTPMTSSFSQLYIYAGQSASALWPDGQERGFSCAIASVDVQLCNTCPSDLYPISSPASIDWDDYIPAPFIVGGLFVNAAIEIDGTPFTNNPVSNTLLWAKYITVDKLGTMGHSFTAIVQNGTFFEMLPNPNCGTVVPCHIYGPNCVVIGTTETLTATPSGGVWSSSNPYIAYIDAATGAVHGIVLTPVTDPITITYTVGDCSFSIPFYVSTDCSRDDHKAAPNSNSTGINNNPISTNGETNITDANNNLSKSEIGQISIYPNPTQNNVTITYPCTSSGQLEISIKDVDGRIRYTESINCNESGNVQQIVDMSTFEQGVYFVELTLNGQDVVKKIVKL